MSAVWLPKSLLIFVTVLAGLASICLYKQEIKRGYFWIKTKAKMSHPIVGGGVLAFILAIVVFEVFKTSLEREISCIGNEELHRISWAIEEKNAQHFEQELIGLYPRLEKCGFLMPLLGESDVRKTQNNSKWHQIHVHFLKVLRRQIRDDEFDIDRWNKDVTNANNSSYHLTKTGTRGSVVEWTGFEELLPLLVARFQFSPLGVG